MGQSSTPIHLQKSANTGGSSALSDFIFKPNELSEKQADFDLLCGAAAGAGHLQGQVLGGQ